MFSGLNMLWKHKDTMLNATKFTKIRKAPNSNGRFSTGKGMKHIKHWYFSVKDKVDRAILILFSPADAPFPEDRMWADVLTKSKSGRLFLEDRSVLVNCPVNYVDNGEFD